MYSWFGWLIDLTWMHGSGQWCLCNSVFWFLEKCYILLPGIWWSLWTSYMITWTAPWLNWFILPIAGCPSLNTANSSGNSRKNVPRLVYAWIGLNYLYESALYWLLHIQCTFPLRIYNQVNNDNVRFKRRML